MQQKSGNKANILIFQKIIFRLNVEICWSVHLTTKTPEK